MTEPTCAMRRAGHLERAAAIVAVVVSVALAWTGVSAHALSSSTSRIAVDGSVVHVVFTINLTDLHNGPNADTNGDGYISVDELDAAIEPIYAAIRANYHVAGGTPVETHVERYQLVDDNVLQFTLTYVFAAPVRQLTLQSTLDRITQPDHRHLVRIDAGGGVREGVLDRSAPTAAIDTARRATFRETAARFVTLGVEHIFTGYDHLAFLFGLLVSATSLIGIVNVVTSFTVAHSLTLGLATFGLVSLPSRVIESLIALSIAYVAVENLLRDRIDGRWRITFFFGLIHGFGFSNVLRDMALPRAELAASLFTFNAGVEIGQVLFVLLVFPVVVALTSTRWKARVVPVCSAVILCLGVYWFCQRAFLT